MLSEPIQLTLRRKLSEEDCQQVVAALRQDPNVWSYLQNAALFAQANAAFDQKAAGWTPAGLAFLALNQECSIDAIRSYPLIPLDADLRQQAVRAFEETLRTQQPPADLGKAGLVALALRERRRLTDSWKGIRGELQTGSAKTNGVSVSTWQTVIACLYGMIPDPQELLQALCPEASSAHFESEIRLVIHALLCNPASAAEQANILVRMVGAYPLALQLTWLQAIQRAGRLDLSTTLASLLQNEPAALVKPGTGRLETPLATNSPIGAQQAIQQILSGQQQAQMHTSAGNFTNALPLWQETHQLIQKMDVQFLLQWAETAHAAGDNEAEISTLHQALSVAPHSAAVKTALAFALLRSGEYDEALQVLPEGCKSSQSCFIRSRIAARLGNTASAREYALQAVRASAPALDHDFLLASLRNLLDLEMIEEAIARTSDLLGEFPADTDLLTLLAAAQIQAGRLDEAIATCHLAVSLLPTSPALRRTLAGYLETNRDWSAALAERTRILQLGVPTTSDYLALAGAANAANQPGEALRVCQIVLNQNPDDGLAHAHLGEALMLLNDQAAAYEHFAQATLLAPELPQPWLALAKAQKNNGEAYKALETLRAATLSAPHSAELQYALGEACLAQNYPSEALPALRKASSLEPKAPHIAISYGTVLRQLGHLSESRAVIERARSSAPNHPELAYAHSQTLIALGENQTALPAMQVSLAAKPTTIEPYIAYARLVLEVYAASPDRFHESSMAPSEALAPALNALHTALDMQPGHLEASVLLAETLKASGKDEAAFDLYHALADNSHILTQEWNCRIKFGLGQVSLALGRHEIALAALQEAAAIQPDNAAIQQTLAETYLAADLTKEALQTAQAALQLAPHAVTNLTWYAWICLSLSLPGEAISALERALEIEPQRGDLAIWLCRVQIQTSQREAARDTLTTLNTLEMASPEEYQQVACLWLTLEDPQAAIQSFEKALHCAGCLPASNWYSLALIYQRCGNTEAALEAVLKAIHAQPETPELLVLQADLLQQSNRNQAAMACLEAALRLNPAGFAPACLPPLPGWRGPLAVTEISLVGPSTDPAVIHQKMAQMLRSAGEYTAALTHAEKSIQANPESICAQSLAGELACSLLDYTTLVKLTPWVETALTETGALRSNLSPDENLAAVNLLCLRAEVELEQSNIDGAKALIQASSRYLPQHPRRLAVLARIAVREGNLFDAVQTLAQAGNPEELNTPYLTLSVAAAALDLYQWDRALSLFARIARDLYMEPQAHLAYARAVVRAAEYVRIAADLQIERHIPTALVNLEEANAIFEKEILAANRLSSSVEISRWHKRGQAVFSPNAQCQKMLSNLPANPEDYAALIAVCKQLGEESSVQEIARLYPDHPAILLQLALALQGSSPAEGFFAARKLVGLWPQSPVYQSCLAKLAYQTGDVETSYYAITSALEVWSDEPEWHAQAARLAQTRGDDPSAAEHLRMATRLEPDQPTYALALGETYLRMGQPQAAVEVLDQTIQLDGSLAETWLTLSAAYADLGDLEKALACAERGAALDPNQPAPLVHCGQLALKAGQLERAYQNARSALALESTHEMALLVMARVMVAQNRPVDALNLLELSIDSIPTALELKLERIELLRALKGAAISLEALQTLAQEHPQDPRILSLLAIELTAAGHRDAAQKTAQAALQADPDQPDLHLLLGRLQRNTGQLDQAIHHLTLAIQQAPMDLEAYLELGRTYQERRDHSQALKVYQQAIRVRPNDPRPYYQASLVLKESKDYINAESMLRRAAELAPEDVNIRRQLGAIVAINLVHHTQETSV